MVVYECWVLTPARCCCHSAVTGSYPGAHCGGRGSPQPRPHACAETEPETAERISSVASSDGARHLGGVNANMQDTPTLAEVAASPVHLNSSATPVAHVGLGRAVLLHS